MIFIIYIYIYLPSTFTSDQVAADGAPYFWAGGRLSGNKRSLSWENGRSESISRGRHPWSFTGSRGAQPDGQGSEDCLAILNNFYNVSILSRDTATFTTFCVTAEQQLYIYYTIKYCTIIAVNVYVQVWNKV